MIMDIRRLGDDIIVDFQLTKSDGTLSDADIAPLCEVFEGTSTTPILTPTPVKRGARTGYYYVVIPATVANGFTLWTSYTVRVAAIVGGVSGSAAKMAFTLLGRSLSSSLAAACGALLNFTRSSRSTSLQKEQFDIVLYKSGETDEIARASFWA
jgi:hypothetical protein